MKLKKLLFVALMMPLILASCSEDINQETMHYAEYAEFYEIPIGAGKGIEMYAWKDNSEWYAGLLPGTNRTKTIDEIIALQENPCPIDIMKEILASYPEYDRYWCALFIVSNPPLESELNHVIDKENPDYIFLCNYFGIKA